MADGAARGTPLASPVMTGLRAVLSVAVALLVTAPTATAVTPPRVDDEWLPDPAPPAPAEATVRRQPCAMLGAAAGQHPGAQLDTLGLASVWPLTRGDGVLVAVIDTGVHRHRQLPGLVTGGDYVAAGVGDEDCDGHGTLIAGIIAAAPAEETGEFSGVAPGATVLTIRQSSTVYGPAGKPARPGVGDVDTMAAAVRTAADRGAGVINIAVTACVDADTAVADRALGAALAYAAEVKDAVVVAAAGGTAHCPAQPVDATWATATAVASPAWYDGFVLSVGSVDPQGHPSAFTLPGPWLDVAAPGEAVVSLNPSGDGLVDTRGGRPIVGTGYAAAVVSGVAALLRARYPQWTAQQVRQRLIDTAHTPPAGWNPLVGHGVIDPAAALAEQAPAPDPGAHPPSAPAPEHPAPAGPPPPAAPTTLPRFTAPVRVLPSPAPAASGVPAAPPRRVPARAVISGGVGALAALAAGWLWWERGRSARADPGGRRARGRRATTWAATL